MYIKVNFSKENGTEEERLYFLIQQYKKVFGYKILSNDKFLLFFKILL